ncbi:MAG TPA: 2-amino-4-hydroxy-6-hydroxymethyldihydropteridine diphosphokinase, partial [Gemmatimonadaceae bacterium]
MIDVAYVALGSNVGDRHGYLAAARRELAELPGTRIVGVSRIEETEPLGGVDQPWYLNQMVA